MTDKSLVLSRYLGQHGLDYQEQSVVPERMYGMVAQLRAAKFRSYTDSASRVLEYGVGLGYNLAGLNCQTKTGFDIGEFLGEGLQNRGIAFVKETAPFGDSSFDVVICHHVLEHTADPWEVLQEIYRLLRRGGALLLFVPYERERVYRRYDRDEKNGHLFSWTPQTLGALVEAVGFGVESIGIQLFGYDRFAASVADRFGFGELGYRCIRKALLAIRPHYEIRAIIRRP